MEEIDLKEVFSTIWNKKIQILLIIVIFITIGTIYTTKFTIPKYSSSTTLVLASSGEGGENGDNTTITTTDIAINAKLIATYSELVKSKNILREVINNLKIPIQEEELRNNVKVKSVNNTELIEIIVEDKNAANAAQIANQMAKVFTEKIKEIYHINNVQIVDEAEISHTPSNINHIKNILTFTCMGVIVAIFYIIISNILDNTIKTAEDIEKEFNMPVLATIPQIEKLKNEIIAHDDPKSPISEIFRTLRTNIQFIDTNKKTKTLLVTSTFPGEGKSCIASNLAATFAQTGKKVVIIDADMRKGRQCQIFDTLATPGLSNYLSQTGATKEIVNYIRKTEVSNLSIMPAGTIPPNPSELLVSSNMEKVLDKFRQAFDIIIIDGTPCELVTDSVILSRIVDGTILITAHKATKKEALRRVIKNIQNVGGNIAGIVINKMPISGKKYEKKYYYYGEDKKQEEKEPLKDEKTESKIEPKEPDKTIEKPKSIKKQMAMAKVAKTTAKTQNKPKKQTQSKLKTTKTNKAPTKTKKTAKEVDMERLEKIAKERTDDILRQMNQYLEKEKGKKEGEKND